MENKQPTQEEFEQFAGDTMGEITKLLQSKGEQYAASMAFENFNRMSALFNISPAQDLLVLVGKHVDALAQWSAAMRMFAPGAIVERTNDIIVYMLLLQFMAVTGCTGIDFTDSKLVEEGSKV